MRRILLLLLPFLISLSTAHAQCCCASITIQLDLPFPATRDTSMSCTVSPGNGPRTSLQFNGDSLLLLTLHTGCGRSSIMWTIRHKWSGQEMRVDLDGMWGDVPYPTIRVPFTSGWYRFDVQEIGRCQADQLMERGLRNAEDPEGNASIDTIACNGGLMAVQRGGWAAGWIRPLNIQNFGWSQYMALPDPTKAAAPSHPGGDAYFQQQLHQRFSKPLIERLNVRTTITGLATVEESGYIHEVNLNGGNYPELDAELKRVVRLSQRWTPASIEDIAATSDRTIYRYIRQSVPISFNVDPDSIWTEIPEDMLMITPTAPTARDSIRITVQWIGGSCGQYTSRTEVLPKEDGSDLNEVILHFGATLPAMCEDHKPQHYTHVMPPLPPGRYRLRRLPHPKLREGGGWMPNPYAVREFVVEP